MNYVTLGKVCRQSHLITMSKRNREILLTVFNFSMIVVINGRGFELLKIFSLTQNSKRCGVYAFILHKEVIYAFGCGAGDT